MRADGLIFLAYDCHIQVHYGDLNPSIYAKAIFTAGALQLGCSTLKHIYIVQHSQGPAYTKGSLTQI